MLFLSKVNYYSSVGFPSLHNPPLADVSANICSFVAPHLSIHQQITPEYPRRDRDQTRRFCTRYPDPVIGTNGNENIIIYFISH